MYYKSTSYKIFEIFNYVILGFLAVLSIFPVLHTLAVSLSSRAPAEAHLVSVWPVGVTLASYMETFKNLLFARAFMLGLMRTLVGTVFSMVVITPAAYALSKSETEFKGRTMYMWFFVFAMMFNGGLVPYYMVIREVGLINSFWVLVIPVAVNVWNMILIMNFFKTGVPKELEEAAMIDGADFFQILRTIYLPLSKPAIVTIGLFTVVFHWNSWFDGLIFMNDVKNYPLATFLQTILIQQNQRMIGSLLDLPNLTNTTIKAAQIFIAIIPVLLVYPYLQKYFIKGIILGAVKG